MQPAPDVPDLAEFQATFEHGDGLVEVPFAEVQKASTETRMDKAVWLIDCTRLSGPLPRSCDALGECSQLGQ